MAIQMNGNDRDSGKVDSIRDGDMDDVADLALVVEIAANYASPEVADEMLALAKVGLL